MVFYDPAPLGIEYDEISERAATLPEPITISNSRSRLVVHIQTEGQAVDDFLALVKTISEEKKAAGFVPLPQGKQIAADNIYDEVYGQSQSRQAAHGTQ